VIRPVSGFDAAGVQEHAVHPSLGEAWCIRRAANRSEQVTLRRTVERSGG